MLDALAGADALTWTAICVQALVYATSLMAAGCAISCVTLRPLPAVERQWLVRCAVVCALAAAVMSGVRLPLRASFLLGGTWQGALDPAILSMVAQSPLGTSIALRIIGLLAILAILIPSRVGPIFAIGGAVAVAASFILRGHALVDPRMILAVLLTVHLVAVAFWIGAFAPLYRLAGSDPARAGEVAHRFGRMAVWGVGVLVITGAVTLWVLTENLVTALSTSYGRFFVLKLTAFIALLGLAAWNKQRLTPALLRNDAQATNKLRRSITLEVALVALILLTTAALTTLSAPGIGDSG